MAKEAKKKYNYQYDTTARAYVNQVAPLKVPQFEPPKKPKAAPKKKVDRAFAVQMSMCGAIIFACSFLYIGNYAQLRVKQNELKALKEEKIVVTDAITKARAQMTSKLDLTQIEQIAMNDLNMTKPLPHQIVYITLPEQSHTTYEQTK